MQGIPQNTIEYAKRISADINQLFQKPLLHCPQWRIDEIQAEKMFIERYKSASTESIKDAIKYATTLPPDPFEFWESMDRYMSNIETLRKL